MTITVVSSYKGSCGALQPSCWPMVFTWYLHMWSPPKPYCKTSRWEVFPCGTGPAASWLGFGRFQPWHQLYPATLVPCLDAEWAQNDEEEVDNYVSCWVRLTWRKGEPSLTIGDNLPALHFFQPWLKRRLHAWVAPVRDAGSRTTVDFAFSARDGSIWSYPRASGWHLGTQPLRQSASQTSSL